MIRRVPPKAGILAAALIAVGVVHFVNPQPFDSMIPQVFPENARRPLTYLSGAAEIVCGTLLLHPRTRRLGGRLTVLLLLAVWPANIDAALRGGYTAFSGFAGTALAAWLRVPLQLPLMWWAWSVSRDAERDHARTAPRGGSATPTTPTAPADPTRPAGSPP